LPRPHRAIHKTCYRYYRRDEPTSHIIECLEGVQISHPPLPEQCAIAHVLRTVQQAKEATEKVIAATRQLKQSLMRHLFTFGPVPFDQADQVALKETEIGDIPKHWNLFKISDVAEVKTSTSSLKTLEQCDKGPVPVFYLKVSDMNHPSNLLRMVTTATITEITEEAADRLNAVRPDAIVFPKRGAAIATNKKRLTTTKCLLDPNLMAVIPREHSLSDFIYRWFERFDLSTITDTTTLPQINKKDIEPLIIPVPLNEEQLQVAKMLGVIDAKIGKEKSIYDSLDSLFKSLLHNLMTGKVRVNDLNFS
jgi:type I restriction enzyme S subunit